MKRLLPILITFIVFISLTVIFAPKNIAQAATVCTDNNTVHREDYTVNTCSNASQLCNEKIYEWANNNNCGNVNGFVWEGCNLNPDLSRTNHCRAGMTCTTCVCVPNNNCTASQCGFWPNTCGGSKNCGGCPAGQGCNSNSSGSCGNLPSCGVLDCGTHTNAFGSSNCQGCQAGSDRVCSSGRCVCPAISVPSSWQCGSVSNACGNSDTKNCATNGTCRTTDHTCHQNYITGIVYIDENGNNTYQASDTERGNVLVRRDANSNYDDRTNTSSPVGRYTFSGLVHDSQHDLQMFNPDTAQFIVEDGTQANAVAKNNTESVPDYNFRLARIYDISGTVYVDTNHNNRLDTTGGNRDIALGTAPYGGSGDVATVRARGRKSDATNRTDVTNGSGAYTITGNQDNDTYDMTLSLPSGWSVINAASDLTTTLNGADRANVDFLVEPPVYSIQGSVFVDDNADGTLQSPREPKVSPFTVNASAGTYSRNGGDYTISGIYEDEDPVVITYTLNSGYYMVYPTPPQFNVSVGKAACGLNATMTSHGATCTNGSVGNLNFAVTDAQAWFQTVGGDIRYSSANFTDPIPFRSARNPDTCASVKGGGRAPGIVLYDQASGNKPFGDSQCGASAPQNWVVSGQPLSASRYVRTSYATFRSRATQAGVGTYTQVSNATPGDLCTNDNFSNCQLKNGAGGTYLVELGGTGTLTLGSAASPNDSDTITGKLVIIVDGNVTISENLVTNAPNALVIAASRNITVTTDVGVAARDDATTENISGVFSADVNFVVQGLVSGDKRLNVGGTVIGGALGPGTGGGITLQRNLRADNNSYPAFTVIERPDFIINYPSTLKEPSYTWTELAP